MHLSRHWRRIVSNGTRDQMGRQKYQCKNFIFYPFCYTYNLLWQIAEDEQVSVPYDQFVVFCHDTANIKKGTAQTDNGKLVYERVFAGFSNAAVSNSIHWLVLNTSSKFKFLGKNQFRTSPGSIDGYFSNYFYNFFPKMFQTYFISTYFYKAIN